MWKVVNIAIPPSASERHWNCVDPKHVLAATAQFPALTLLDAFVQIELILVFQRVIANEEYPATKTSRDDYFDVNGRHR